MHPHAAAYIHMHPSRIRMHGEMHLYACIRLIYALEHRYSTHLFSEMSQSHKNITRKRKTPIMTRNVETVRIQPKISNRLEASKANKNIFFRNTFIHRNCSVFCSCVLYCLCGAARRGAWGQLRRCEACGRPPSGPRGEVLTP